MTSGIRINGGKFEILNLFGGQLPLDFLLLITRIYITHNYTSIGLKEEESIQTTSYQDANTNNNLHKYSKYQFQIDDDEQGTNEAQNHEEERCQGIGQQDDPE